MTNEVSQKIKNMSIICALLVVTIHVDWQEHTSTLLWWGRELICQGVAKVAVPFFFVVSGYFLSAHFDEEYWWKREVTKRIRSLVVPYFLWSLIAVLITAPVTIIADSIAKRPFGTSLPLLNGKVMSVFGLNIFNSPTHGPLWYMRCLFLFVIFGGLFKWGVRKMGLCWLVILFSLSCVHCFFMNGFPEGDVPRFFLLFERGISLSGMFYFSLGIYIRDKKFKYTDISPITYCSLVLGSCLLVGRALLVQKNQPQITGVWGLISIPFLMYAFYKLIPSTTWPIWLTSCSFPIYLMHTIVQLLLGVFFKNVTGCTGWVIATTYFLVGVIVPICITHVIRRTLPQTSNCLLGHRFRSGEVKNVRVP